LFVGYKAKLTIYDNVHKLRDLIKVAAQKLIMLFASLYRAGSGERVLVLKECNFSRMAGSNLITELLLIQQL